jgi:hypothetical protein
MRQRQGMSRAWKMLSRRWNEQAPAKRALRGARGRGRRGRCAPPGRCGRGGGCTAPGCRECPPSAREDWVSVWGERERRRKKKGRGGRSEKVLHPKQNQERRDGVGKRKQTPRSEAWTTRHQMMTSSFHAPG